jgi:hypothetical protein
LDFRKNAFEIAKNIVIPESKHPVTILGQATVSYSVCSGVAMLSAVHFNNQKSFTANEIAYVIGDRFLPHKFMSVDLPIANAIPENGFRVRLIDA